MNDRNGEGAGALMVIGLIMVVAQLIFAVVAAVAICFTAAFTLVAIAALLCDGVTLWGEHTSRKEAIQYFVRGAIGAVAVPLFLALVLSFLPWDPQPSEVASSGWTAFAGFAFGSWGIELLKAIDAEEKAKAEQYIILPPLPDHEVYTPPVMPTVEPVKPFHFASWDDEERSL